MEFKITLVFLIMHSTGCDFVLFSFQFDSLAPSLWFVLRIRDDDDMGISFSLLRSNNAINFYCEMSTDPNIFFQTSVDIFFFIVIL